MKKLIYSFLIIAATQHMVLGQIFKFSGELKPINNSSVSGYFSGYFDHKTSLATVVGTASSFGVSVDSKPLNNLDIPLVPTSGLIYNLQNPTFAIVNTEKTLESISNNRIDVNGLTLYVLFKTEFVTLNSIFNAVPANNYTFVLNSGVLPVAYGTFFVPIPEPSYMTICTGLMLIGFISYRKKKS